MGNASQTLTKFTGYAYRAVVSIAVKENKSVRLDPFTYISSTNEINFCSILGWSPVLFGTPEILNHLYTLNLRSISTQFINPNIIELTLTKNKVRGTIDRVMFKLLLSVFASQDGPLTWQVNTTVPNEYTSTVAVLYVDKPCKFITDTYKRLDVLFRDGESTNVLTFFVFARFDVFGGPSLYIQSPFVSEGSKINGVGTNFLSTGNIPINTQLIKNISTVGKLLITYESDQLGRNLGEMVATIISNKRYPNGYFKSDKKDNIEQYITFWSKRPNLKNVLKYSYNCFKHLYDQTSFINKRYGFGMTDDVFFVKILEYSTLKYMLAGIANNGKFSKFWLYRNHHNEFLRLIENSEFSSLIGIFITDYIRYEKFFIKLTNDL